MVAPAAGAAWSRGASQHGKGVALCRPHRHLALPCILHSPAQALGLATDIRLPSEAQKKKMAAPTGDANGAPLAKEPASKAA